MRCPKCGSEESGRYCARCGEELGSAPLRCGGCGAALAPGARYCGACGTAVGSWPGKPLSARLPWILSAVALAAFALAIAVLVQRASAPRTPGGSITGGIPGASPQGGEPSAAGGRITAEELAAMTPRQAADRLFDRAMTEAEQGNAERARFFAQMGREAYGQMDPGELDGDARFHIGLLALVTGDTTGARAQAEEILAGRPTHLLGLILAARTAQAAGDEEGARRFYDRLGAAIAGGESPDDPEYASHGRLIEQEAERASR
ncbi:MAG: hypothetical protein ACE5HP_06460 [Gemmatimonadota bacterium]